MARPRANFTRRQKLAFARKMRNHPTRAEKMLYRELQRLGVKIGRQILVLGWIADFYDPESKLVVELDGPFHIAAKDRYRDKIMRDAGYLVLRYPNEAVFGAVKYVAKEIRDVMRSGAI